MAGPKSTIRRAWWGVIVLFLVHGLVVSSWISRIPAIQAKLQLPNGVLGLTLLSSAVGAVLVIPLVGNLVSRYGSRAVGVLSSMLFCTSVIPLGLAWNAVTLAAGLFAYGACAAAMDVSMNAQGVEVEKRLGKPTMSRFHALFSGGAMLGAAIGGWVARTGVEPWMHFAGSSMVNLLLVLLAAPFLIADEAQITPGSKPARLRWSAAPPVLHALSAIAFCILLAEGAMADWTAVYLKQVLNAGPGTAAAGYSVFSGAMAIFRFLGDWTTAALGPLRTTRWSCLLAAGGLVLALAPATPLWTMPGLAICGIGLSVVIPLVFGAGGRVPGVSPGPGIATVTGLGYIGFIVGPPTIGFVSQYSNLRVALVVVVLCCLCAGWLAGYMRLLEPGREPVIAGE